MTTAVTAAPTAAESRSAVLTTIRKISSIATLPEITTQIVKTVENPRSTPAQLHRIVSHDPALVTRILKVVNSAFYGLPGQIASMERAIVLLGLNAVKNIAVATSLGQLFRGTKLGESHSARDLWTHCVAVAVCARELARRLKLPLGDEAFLAGMIHDIGIVVALQAYPEKLRDICNRSKAEGGRFCELERQIAGMDHQELGAALAEQWKFPRSCQLVAGSHHEPAAMAEQNRVLVLLVYAADTLCAQAHYGFDLTAAGQEINRDELASLSITPALIESLRAELPDRVREASGIFD